MPLPDLAHADSHPSLRGCRGIPSGSRRRHHCLQPLGGAPSHAALAEVRLGRPSVRPADGRAPLRILHLSDLHLSPRDTDRIDWVRIPGRARRGPDRGDRRLPRRRPGTPARAGRPGAPARSARLFVRGSNDYYAPAMANPARLPARSQRAAHEAAQDRRHTPRPGPRSPPVAGPGQRGCRGCRPRLADRCAPWMDDPHMGAGTGTPTSPGRSIRTQTSDLGSPMRPTGGCSMPWPPTVPT